MRHVSLFVFLILMSVSSVAEWQPLPERQGHQLQIDNSTNRVQILNADGTARPMWDGIHRLDNGQVLRINKGIAVRDKTVMQALSVPQMPVEEVAVCTILQRQSCGLRNHCGGTESCELANQLQSFYLEAGLDERGSILSQCQDALVNKELFKTCPVPHGGVFKSACNDLVIKSCGMSNQCGQSESCSMAKQMQSMEYDEHLIKFVPSDKTFTTGQCEQVFADDQVFVPCLSE